MDSGNSGSLQSSSGGDEEYDSRAPDYAFMSAIPNAPAQFIDPLSAYLQLHQNPNSLLLNSPNPLRSDPNPSHVTGFSAPAPFTAASPLSNSHHQQQAVRNPKKRSRASRRAPTTVLTTDTTNFRAMVQEFTGIPAPPFSNSSSFPRSRIDLFAPRSAASFDSPPPPPYLRRHHLPNLFNIPIQNQNQNQNQNILTSLLQSNAKFPFPASSKPQNSPQNDYRFGFDHRNQASETLPNLIPSDHSQSDLQRNDFGGKISNFSSSASNGGKLPESNVRGGGGGEGMVESWICSSE